MEHFLTVSSILLGFGFSIASAQQGPFDLTGPGLDVSTLYVLGSSDRQIVALALGHHSALTLNLKYSVGDPGPVCFLEIVGTTRISHWRKPCPLMPQRLPPVGFWCQFGFSQDRNLVLASGPNDQNKMENPTMLWSINSSGLGATSLGLLDSDVAGLGNMVLYNANKEIVWGNIAADAPWEGHHCTWMNPVPVGAPLSAAYVSPVGAPDGASAPTPQAGRKLLAH